MGYAGDFVSKRRTIKKKESKITNYLSSASGTGAIAGAHQVCHSICMGLVSFLSVFGVVVSADALMFLQDYAISFWLMGLFFFLISIYFYLGKGKGPKKLIIFNAGILIAGIPFVSNWIFWLVGGALIVYSVFLFVKGRFSNKRRR